MSTLKTNNIQHVDRSDPSIIINTDGSVNIAGTMTYEDVTNVDAVGIITGRSNIDAQKQVHVGTGVSVKAGGINVTAGITTVQALQATTGTFSSTGAFSDNVSIVKAGGPVLELCNNTATTTMALRLHEGAAGSLVNGGGMTYDGASNKLHITCGTNLRTERITIDRDTGNVGVGLTSPEGLFHTRTSSGTNRNYIEASASHAFLRLKAGSTSYNSGLEFYSGSSNISNLTALGGGGFAFEVGGSERFRIDSGGRLVIGHTSALTVAGHQGFLQLNGDQYSQATFQIVNNANSANGSYIQLSKQRSGSAGGNTIVQNGDNIGKIRFTAADGTNLDSRAAEIEVEIDGAPGENDTPGRMILSTTADGAQSTTERMRIDSSGRIGIQGAATKGVLDVRASGGSATMLTAVLGANEGQTGGTLSDNTDKGARVGLYHYDTDEEPYSLFSSGATNGANSINFGGGTSLMNAATSIGFYTAANSTTTNGTKRMDVGSSGDITINTGNIVIGTDGKGIDFSITGNGGTGTPSELFDDYEEGSWNVTSLNYDYDGNQAQRGRYIKIGRMVYAFYRVKFHNQSTHTGNHLRWTGLPFTAQSGGTDDIGVAAHAHEYSTIDFFRVYVQPGSTYAYWYTSTGSNFNNSTSLNNADVRGCIIYRASY